MPVVLAKSDPVPLPEFLPTLGAAVGAALAVIVAIWVVLRLAGRRWFAASELARHCRIPFRLLVLLLAVSAVADAYRPDVVAPAYWSGLKVALRMASIGAGAWLVGAALLFVEDLSLQRWSTDVPHSKNARRARTQVLVLRRLTVAVVVVVAFGAALLTFPGVRAIGASVLASAGLISIVAALAAQSMLANVIAGLQLAFSDAIRLDDVVVVDGQWGKIEEITLSYVVLRSWDERRFVFPSTFFVQNPFENWTKYAAELTGTVELDLDWDVDVDDVRDALDRALAATDLWDERAKVVQVTDAVAGWVRVRVLVTAVDASTLFDLRCHVREHLVAWVRRERPAGLPRQRVEVSRRTPSTDAGEQAERPPRPGVTDGDTRPIRVRGGPGGDGY